MSYFAPSHTSCFFLFINDLCFTEQLWSGSSLRFMGFPNIDVINKVQVGKDSTSVTNYIHQGKKVYMHLDVLFLFFQYASNIQLT